MSPDNDANAYQALLSTKKKLKSPFIFLLQISKIFLSLHMTLSQKKASQIKP